jgi:hypothetical protein
MENTKDITGHNALNIMEAMVHFQNVHNELRNDFSSIYAITVSSTEPKQHLIRSCIKELFTLIEADVYLYNQYNPYAGFDDSDAILDKFKKTFKHHGREFNKLDSVIAFNSKWFEHLKMVKLIRDRITHPKGKGSIQVSLDDLSLTFKVYDAYANFVNDIMTATALSIKLPIGTLFNR